jgi:hypothetical protein
MKNHPPQKKNKKKTHKKASNTEKKRGHVRKSPKDKKGEPIRKTRIKMLNKLIQKKYYKKKSTPLYKSTLLHIYIILLLLLLLMNLHTHNFPLQL